ncbi:DUF6912 family protein [Buchananella hordeovulneris]|uniref:DUF6912 family protein n=1 Tax=Buchananella hordeovulneris TaxID=52770 RepID=UPI000F5E9091|nr:hypothetical protein [Buchananella hordeovulneris]RRD43169.1 hypothetical protein EII13_07825 [Buchananella hordeovulneris]RRD53170.1 hypothetical protein EII12_02570 [Buchananella hordeovulneris]
MRVYLAAAPAALVAPQLEAEIVYAVTPALAAVFPDDDEEELEAIAALCAAELSLSLLGAGPARRLVVAADVEPERLREVTDREDLYTGALALDGPVAWEEAVSLHLDDVAAEEAVRAARSQPERADELLAEHDLLWFDITERGKVAASLGL